MIDLVNILGHTYLAGYGYTFDSYLWLYLDKGKTRGVMLMGNEVIGIR